MKVKVFTLLRTFMFVALMPVLSLSMVSCEPEEDVEDVPSVVEPEDKEESESKEETDGGASDDSGEGAEAEDTTSEIAVTSLVDKFGCTYADINGYANLNLLPTNGSGNSVIGVELVDAYAKSNENAVQATAGSLTGNVFTVSFSNLSPATEYKYRSFVTYGGMTYYATKYKTFTTKEVVSLTSSCEVSEVKYSSAVLSASVQTEDVESRDDAYIGFAWSTLKSDLCAEGNFENTKISVMNVSDGMYSASLSGLSDGTTYYYSSFTKVGEVYVFSSVNEFTTKEIPEGAVDLGLSVLWASHNVGAKFPEDSGGYYAWGEVEGIKSDYSWSTYKWSNGRYKTLTKYCIDSDYGTVDNKTTLDPEDDVAHVQWGNSWRMPTTAELNELRNNCDWNWISGNGGISGYQVTGPNGNSIFLRAAGRRDGRYVQKGSCGYYWSATLSEYDGGSWAVLFSFDDSPLGQSFFNPGSGSRYYGCSIRPVTE